METLLLSYNVISSIVSWWSAKKINVRKALCARLCVCACVCACVCMLVCVHVCVGVCVLGVCVHLCVCVHVWGGCVCVLVCMIVHICVCACECVCVWMCVCGVHACMLNWLFRYCIKRNKYHYIQTIIILNVSINGSV